MKSLIFVTCLALVLPFALIAETEIVDGVKWAYYVENGEACIEAAGAKSSLTLSAIPNTTSGALMIPSVLGGYVVSSIGWRAFVYCSKLTSVIIPDSVRSIGLSAFYGCSNLTSVVISDSVTSIDIGAFKYCKQLTTITIPKGVTEIGNETFGECSMLTSVSLPAGLRIIGSRAFRDCTSLTSIAIPSGVESIGGGAFAGCRGLADDDGFVVLRNVLYCSRQTSGVVKIPDGVTCISDYAFYNFYNCNQITGVTMPPSVTSIGEFAFDCCRGLTSLSLPNGVTSIGRYAFRNCSGLTNLVLPDDLRSIGDEAFDGCTGLKGEIDLKNTENIAQFAFYGCGVTSFILHKSIMSVGYGTFGNCSSLKSIFVAPGDVARIKDLIRGDYIDVKYVIGDVAFIELESLTVTFDARGGDVEEEQRRVEERCKIGKLPLPTKTGYEFLGWFTELVGGEEVTAETVVTKDMTVYARWKCDFQINDGVLLRYTGSSVDVVIPANVSSIGRGAFSECENVVSVVIPEGVTNIGYEAFYDCWNLSSITLPESLVSIDDRAFRFCYALGTVAIPRNVTRIGNGAFNCFDTHGIGERVGALSNVTMVADVMHMGESVFSGTIFGEKFNAKICNAIMSPSRQEVCAMTLMTSNIVMHYIVNSVQPSFVLPATYDTGFVNIIAEVKGGCVAVPATWTVNYPKFTEKFGSDFTKALAMKTGKKDGAGNPMFVWQDYVAGTDPTDETDVFTASITIVDGKVKVSYSPELGDARKALRKYTTWGKVSLLDTGWTEVEPGKEGDYNFFKVTVEMR